MVGCSGKQGCAESRKKELGLRKRTGSWVMGHGLTRLGEVSIYRVCLKLEFVTDEHKISGLWRR
ncbi:hypothetical protein MTR_8g465360 [Medicago truncatula]|uniref:Uncharacterized protein n=1 Tax=Medicago truncatula TaxID=3880 RepID=A0A072TQE5_MEDTR|nr:hypothetical protein MTR_8g465360 [Medicago truncatula]